MEIIAAYGPAEFWEPFGAVLKRLRTARKLRQLDLATQMSVDHSLVSRWESSTVLPVARDLESLRNHLQLSDEDCTELQYAWRRERETLEHARFGSLVRSDANNWVESIRVSIDCVRALRYGGQPRMAMLLSGRDALSALDSLRGQAWGPSHEQALIELAELLLEECKAGLDYLPRSAVRNGRLERPLKIQEFIAAAVRNTRVRVLSRICREGTSYVAGNFGTAHEIGQSLLDSREHLPLEWVPEVVRACAINAGRLDDVEGLFRVDAMVSSGFLDENADLPAGTRAFVLEGLARGMVVADADRAVEILGESWQVRENALDAESVSKLRFVQLVRTQAEIEVILRSHGNREDTLDKISEAFIISKDEGYDRYVQQLAILADKLA